MPMYDNGNGFFGGSFFQQFQGQAGGQNNAGPTGAPRQPKEPTPPKGTPLTRVIKSLVITLIFAAVYFYYQISKATAEAFGKPEAWAWGYFFLSPVFWMITGFDDSSYYGPYGEGDSRTGEARQAKTVDFDVVKDTPEPAPARAKQAAAPSESDVEFDFYQQDEISE